MTLQKKQLIVYSKKWAKKFQIKHQNQKVKDFQRWLDS
jgi:hypothetical protein